MPSTSQARWSAQGISEFTQDTLRALLDSQIPAIRFRGFATQAECEALVTAIDEDAFAYSPQQSPPIGRIGITQYGHRTAPEAYFAGVPDAHHAVQQLFSRAFDPVARVIAALRDVWPAAVEVADSERGRYHAGLIRLIHDYAGLHFDFVPIEGRGWSIDDITAQISWNLHLSAPGSGGACVVYDRRCEVEHEAVKADPDALLADPELVSDRPFVTLDSIVGDIVLFNTRSYHEILPCRGGRRITVSSFIGRKPDGSLVLWS
ncbi:MAG: hypothetical protein P4M00_15120 [Azospirillaceae bacterium]|nr:hypothetical protein [Azospirillaceae bacterium]